MPEKYKQIPLDFFPEKPDSTPDEKVAPKTRVKPKTKTRLKPVNLEKSASKEKEIQFDLKLIGKVFSSLDQFLRSVQSALDCGDYRVSSPGFYRQAIGNYDSRRLSQEDFARFKKEINKTIKYLKLKKEDFSASSSDSEKKPEDFLIKSSKKELDREAMRGGFESGEDLEEFLKK